MIDRLAQWSMTARLPTEWYMTVWLEVPAAPPWWVCNAGVAGGRWQVAGGGSEMCQSLPFHSHPDILSRHNNIILTIDMVAHCYCNVFYIMSLLKKKRIYPYATGRESAWVWSRTLTALLTKNQKKEKALWFSPAILRVVIPWYIVIVGVSSSSKNFFLYTYTFVYYRTTYIETLEWMDI